MEKKFDDERKILHDQLAAVMIENENLNQKLKLVSTENESLNQNKSWC